jgi:hypothetical protein
VAGYARFRANELPKLVGRDEPDGARKSDGRAGHLCHGPYMTLSPGRYTAGFYLRRDPEDAEGEVEVDVCTEHGKRVLASRTVPVRQLFGSIAGLVWLDFVVHAVEHACELRLEVPANARIEVTEAVLFRRDVSDWGRL